MRLTGWQRLSIFLFVLWTTGVGFHVWRNWPPEYLSVDPNAGIPPGADVTYLMNGIINKDVTLTRAEFAARIKRKYPEYADLGDAELVARTLKKYPYYSAFIETEDGFLPDPPKAVEAMNRDNRRKAIQTGLSIWLLPPVALIALARGIRWVFKGFKIR
jgi:hypothetical protein